EWEGNECHIDRRTGRMDRVCRDVAELHEVTALGSWPIMAFAWSRRLLHPLHESLHGLNRTITVIHLERKTARSQIALNKPQGLRSLAKQDAFAGLISRHPGPRKILRAGVANVLDDSLIDFSEVDKSYR